jgi:hypothetical protein
LIEKEELYILVLPDKYFTDMRRITLLLFCLWAGNTFSQILNLPPRQTTALSGSQFVATIWSSSMGLTTREDSIYAQVLKGNVPDFYRNLVPVTSKALIGSDTQKVTYYVAPDYFAIGCDSDYFLCPMSPMTATKIASLTGTTLPTRKMVGDIWKAAQVKMNPQPLSPGPLMSTVPYFAHHDTLVDSARKTFMPAHPLGQLVSGDKKDVIISHIIDSVANRVVIFGWYYPTGTYIQPMTDIHADVYMDYSHGLRFVQNNCWLNDTTPTTIQCIVESATLSPILSDEGTINLPWYPYWISLNTPTSFAWLRNTPTSLKLEVENDPSVTHYDVYTSTDGANYTEHLRVKKSNLIIDSLKTDKVCFVRLIAYDSNAATTSLMSEMLASVPSSRNDSTLIVSGFERNIAGNTYNFTIQHGTALFNNNRYMESCTHKAITDKLVSLDNYRAVDWILGEESVADTSFDPREQNYISSYLEQGGYLFTSGSEIGYNLVQFGTAADKLFYSDYLKARYISDAPDNKSGTYYSSNVQPIASSIYMVNDTVNFDNGTHGTYNVPYPDAIAPINGASADMHYATLDTEYACIHYAGVFPSGSKIGKLVYMAYPFETIYPAPTRDTVMKDILIFFFGEKTLYTGIAESAGNDLQVNVYPNPVKDELTIVMPQPAEATVKIYNMLGQQVYTSNLDGNEPTQTINMSGLSQGMYLLTVESGSARYVSRIVKE